MSLMSKNELNLTEAEEKFLLGFEKYIKNIYVNYISIGISLCGALVGFIVGIKFDKEEGFFWTIFFGGICIILFLLSHIYKKLYTIIAKMKQYIKELEKET